MDNIAEYEGNLGNFHYGNQNPLPDQQQDQNFFPGDYPTNLSGLPDSSSQFSDTVSLSQETMKFDPNLVTNLRRKTAPPLRLMNIGPFSGSHHDSPNLTPRTDDSSPHSRKSDSGKKRGKYKIYSEEEKASILTHMSQFGIEKTLQDFASQDDKLTRRKLKSWIESQSKVKGIKGRKSSDANRDTRLFEWCIQFQKEKSRAPTRKEAAKKALELSSDDQFKASKGWLDKFSHKFDVEFTPLKVFPSRSKPKLRRGPDDFDSPTDVYSPSLDGNSSYYSNTSQIKEASEVDEGELDDVKKEEPGLILFEGIHPLGHTEGQIQGHKSLFSQYSNSKPSGEFFNNNTSSIPQIPSINHHTNFVNKNEGYTNDELTQINGNYMTENMNSNMLGNNMNHLVNHQVHLSSPQVGYGVQNNSLNNLQFYHATNYVPDGNTIPKSNIKQINNQCLSGIQPNNNQFQMANGTIYNRSPTKFSQNKINIPLINNNDIQIESQGYHHDPTPQVKLEDYRNDTQWNELQNAFSEIELNSFLNLGAEKSVSPKDFETFINNATPKNLQNYYGGTYQDPSPKNLESLLNSQSNNFSSQEKFQREIIQKE